MLPQMLYRALLVTMACIMLLSVSPATAIVWMERMTGTIGTMQSVSRAVVIEAPRHGEGREVQGGQGMSILLCFSGVILGVLLALLLGSRVLLGWQSRTRRQGDIDRLIAQFQALFQEMDQGKNHRP
jgi:hypothetical protein